MRIAFFGLDYHARTGSSRFFLDLLERHAEVEAFFSPPDVATLRARCAGFDETRYDAIIVWQLHEAFALLSGRHPNVTFAPMHDAMWRGGAFLWKPSFNAAKILCFSWALRAEVMRRAPVHRRVQYFPDPAAHPPVTDFATLRGFLWYRRRDIPPELIFARTAGTRFARITIHDAPDPGHEAALPAAAPGHVGALATTRWSADGSSFAAALRDANVFFASRPMEGIGMSFLEAMAAGLCVVAPDAPTMNEYISHGSNGLLAAPGSAAPMDFSAAREIGARARESMVRGHAAWVAGIPGLMEFLATPMAALRGMVRPAATPAAMPAGWHILRGPGVNHDAAALERAIAAAPPAAGIIRGDLLCRDAEGAEHLQRIGEFSAGWARLLAGEANPDGPTWLGRPEAALIRAEVLDRLGLPAPQDAPALAGLLLAARQAGVAVADAGEVFASAPPPADPGALEEAWAALVARHARPPGRLAERVQAALRQAAELRRERVRAAAGARRAVAAIAALDGISPRLGLAAEALLTGGAVRRLRRLLRR